MSPTVVAPEGEIDIATVEEFRRALRSAVESASDGLVIDLSDVSFIESSGLGAVIEAQHRLRRAGSGLAVVAPRGSTAAVLLTLTGLRRQLRVHETRRAALADGTAA